MGIVNVKKATMKRILICLLFLTFFIQTYSQSTKERLVALTEQNKYLNDRIKLLSEKVETQEKTVWNLENKLKLIESKLLQLESTPNTNVDNKQTAKQNNNTTIESPKNDTKSENNNEQPKSFGQCKAITAKGTKCSRQGGATGFCWQHNK